MKIKELLEKYKALILYGVFGVLTTAVNFVVYYLCYNVAAIPNLPSAAIAWVAAVAFAFITNKLWVFDSKSFAAKTLLREAAAFFAARALTGLLDLGIMAVAVDIMHWNASLWKLLSNVVVIILNYIASKRVIFKK